jgi:cysteine dioxygenase
VRAAVSIAEFVSRLVQLEGHGFETEAVQRHLLEIAIASSSLRPYLHFHPTHYMRNLIYRTDRFELLAICWESGQAAPIHDHDEQRCWARVEHGTLRFTNFDLVGDTPLLLQQAGPAVSGTRGHLDALAGIHKVENHVSSTSRAVSLHLYASPFAECTTYDPVQGIKQRRQLGYDTVPEPPHASRAERLSSATGVSRLLSSSQEVFGVSALEKTGQS